ncbi:MAG: hypothetical protein P8Y97_12570 [Candidatus Lokiarchaeota archaeon]
MTWIPLLLTDPSPCLRLKVLKELMNKPDGDPEVMELKELLEKDPIYQRMREFQNKAGFWEMNTANLSKSKNKIQTTALEMNRLGYLGFNKTYEITQKAANFLFSQQNDDGSWPLPGKGYFLGEEDKYESMPIQTAIPLIGLAICGYATDERCEKAFDWLLKQKLDDGAWPVGINSGVYGGIAGYRKLAHSKWGCRSNTTAVLRSFCYHPKRRNSAEAKRALDMLLATDMKPRHDLGFYIARIIGAETSYGRITFYAKFDIAQILDLCWRIGADKDDLRVKKLIDFMIEERGVYGLWKCIPHPKVSKWLTFDILRSLSNLEKEKEWISLEPITPFRAYPKKLKRF